MSDNMITGSNVPVPSNLVGLTDAQVQAIVAEEALDQLRQYRDKKLVESDWTNVQDSPITGSKLTEWQTYRQSLRDITDTYSNIQEVVWPTKPS
jgi:hypothetical protein